MFTAVWTMSLKDMEWTGHLQIVKPVWLLIAGVPGVVPPEAGFCEAYYSNLELQLVCDKFSNLTQSSF